MVRHRSVRWVCALACAVGLGTVGLATADNGPDPGFGTGGSVGLSFGSAASPELAFDSHLNIVAVGEWIYPVSSVGIARITPEGRIDGTQGSFSLGTKFGFATSYGYAGAVDGQDRVVIGGVGNDTTSFVGRLLPSGAPDAVFGANGVAYLPANAGGASFVSDVALDGKGRIVALQANRLIRLTSAGSLDTTFGTGGVTDAVDAYRMVVASDGSILTAGQVSASGGTVKDASVRRFDADGKPDPSFGVGGQVTVDIPHAVTALQDFHVDAQGRMLLGGGLAIRAFESAAVVFRLTPVGALDTTFGVGGVVQIPAGDPGDRPFTTGIDTAVDGTIVTGGVLFRGQQTFRVSTVLTDTGAFDPDYNGGVPLVSGDGTDRITSVLAESTSSFLFAAGKQSGSGSTIVRQLLRRPDRTPPTLTVPADQTVEASSAAGATASFTGLGATDAVDPAPTAICDAVAATVFPLGATTVTCVARDASGNTASGSFRVTVVDTTAPVLTLPAPFGVDATSPAGAVVGFVTVAVDKVDGSRPVSCLPESGALLAIGDTTVSCAAADTRGNRATGSTTVHVRGADEQFARVIASVTEWKLLRDLRRIDRPLERSRETCRRLDRAEDDAGGIVAPRLAQVAAVLGCGADDGRGERGRGHGRAFDEDERGPDRR